MHRAAVIALALALGASAAAADPEIDHVVAAPTAWLPEAGVAIGRAALDHRGGGELVIGYGLGGIAEVEAGDSGATFRLGAHQDAWFAGQPAIAFGVTESLPGEPRAGEAYVVASRVLGPLRVHAGAIALDAESTARMKLVVRPLGGLELVPPQYPRTTIVGDLTWQATLVTPRPVAGWVIGYGVRYQALSWGSIELAVRVRQDEGVSGSTVLVRVNGVWRP